MWLPHFLVVNLGRSCLPYQAARQTFFRPRSDRSRPKAMAMDFLRSLCDSTQSSWGGWPCQPTQQRPFGWSKIVTKPSWHVVQHGASTENLELWRSFSRGFQSNPRWIQVGCVSVVQLQWINCRCSFSLALLWSQCLLKWHGLLGASFPSRVPSLGHVEQNMKPWSAWWSILVHTAGVCPPLWDIQLHLFQYQKQQDLEGSNGPRNRQRNGARKKCRNVGSQRLSSGKKNITNLFDWMPSLRRTWDRKGPGTAPGWGGKDSRGFGPDLELSRWENIPKTSFNNWFEHGLIH